MKPFRVAFALLALAVLSGCVAVPESSGYVPAPVYVAPDPLFYGPSLFFGVEGHRHHRRHNHGGRNGRLDRDGDGIPNYRDRDRDRDGDGVRNSRDRRPNNPRRN